MAGQPLTSLDRSTLRERALEALRIAISSGQYRPGITSVRRNWLGGWE